MPPERGPARVAVVGGGITGLATAWFLRQSPDPPSVTLYEAGDRLGGKLRTAELDGVPVEEGPDTFLARVPEAVDLCRRLGLGDELVTPATGKAYVWTRGRLRPLPGGTVLGVPYRLGPLARSGLVSPVGLARAALDLVLPARRWGDDPSLAHVVGARFGREVVDRLTEPLLGGIHASTADRLSLAAVAPQVAAALPRHRSLMRALREDRPATPEGPVFMSLRGGVERLVDQLAKSLPEVDVRLGAPVASLGDLEGEADAVVLTVPAYAAAGLVAGGAASRELAAIEYASVVTATLRYRAGALPGPLDGSGFLVPRVEGRLITACTWLTSKWPLVGAAAGGDVLLRASAGRIGDERALGMDDARLLERVHAELAEAMGLRSAPVAAHVTRWPRALPQYDAGHAARVERIRAGLPPHVHVAGAAYGGVGIAACVRQAQEAAATVLASTA